MKRLLVASTALLGLSLAVQAQIWGGGRDPYGRDDRWGRNGGSYGRGGAAPIDRAISDLTRMRGGWFNSDRKHIDKAIGDLTKFQDKLYREGKFDSGRLDKAISNMEKIAQNSSRIFGGGQRNTIFRDLDDLRAFRASGGRYDSYNRGGYGSYDPYGYPGRGRYPYP